MEQIRIAGFYIERDKDGKYVLYAIEGWADSAQVIGPPRIFKVKEVEEHNYR